MIAPKPCPVCNGTELGINCLESYGQYEAQYFCLGCESEGAPQGPVSDPCGTAEEAEASARRAWNDFVAGYLPYKRVSSLLLAVLSAWPQLGP